MYIYIYLYRLFIFMLRASKRTESQSDKIECHKPRQWTATYKATILKTKPKCFATFNEPFKQIYIYFS
uniref:Putative secreted protein n=1 Tax=Amblyomma triste TaxID=251400 RepID=A0A023FZM5_AMBTT